MPFRCGVPGCNGNYSAEEKVHVFSYPTEEVLRKTWASAIHRDNFITTKNSRVCERHFAQESRCSSHSSSKLSSVFIKKCNLQKKPG
nr:unnamed protein product [Callosobruchus analis]